MPDDQPPLLAVLIDADNTSPKMADAILAEIATLGEASVRRIYGDFSSGLLRGWADILAQHAILPHQQFANTIGKNSSDIALVIDAMDLLHSGRFDGFCLVSSDSDFTRLASRIREHGLDVYGFGQKKTPAAFRAACKRFFFLENLGQVDDTAAALPEETKESPAKVAPLVHRAMEGLEDENGWYRLDTIGNRLQANYSDFDPRSYGCAKLSDLLEKSKKFEVDKKTRPARMRPVAKRAARKRK